MPLALTLRTLLLLMAILCAGLAAFGVPSRVQLGWVGVAFVAAALLVT